MELQFSIHRTHCECMCVCVCYLPNNIQRPHNWFRSRMAINLSCYFVGDGDLYVFFCWNFRLWKTKRKLGISSLNYNKFDSPGVFEMEFIWWSIDENRHIQISRGIQFIFTTFCSCVRCVFAGVPVLSHTEFRKGNRTWNRNRSCIQWFAMCSRCNMWLYFTHIKSLASTLSFKTLENGFNSALFKNCQWRSMKTTSHNWKLLKFSFAIIIIILMGAMR